MSENKIPQCILNLPKEGLEWLLKCSKEKLEMFVDLTEIKQHLDLASWTNRAYIHVNKSTGFKELRLITGANRSSPTSILVTFKRLCSRGIYNSIVSGYINGSFEEHLKETDTYVHIEVEYHLAKAVFQRAESRVEDNILDLNQLYKTLYYGKRTR